MMRTIHFSGYDWFVRPAEVGGPGPNHWDPGAVRVDASGALHLKIVKLGNVWRCAEVYTQRTFGFGRYQFQVTGPIDRLDRNVVFGLFNYPQPDVGPDGTNEIDIEYSHWGNPTYPLGNYTVYPAHAGLPPGSQTFPVAPGTPTTTQTFDWQSGSVTFHSARGQSQVTEPEFAGWNYAPSDSQQHVPQKPLPVHINLWLFAGAAPRDGREVEVVVKKFAFTPAPAPARPMTAAGSSRPWVSAYYASWQDAYLPPPAIDFGAFSHLIHFAMLPRPDGTINDTAPDSITPAQSQAVVTAAHQAGCKVLLCFGGADTIAAFRPALADAVRPAFARNVVHFLIARGYDGADIDIEPLDDADVPSYEKLIHELHTQIGAVKPGLLLTAATASQPALFARLQPDFDQINLMTYDLSGPWEGFKTWYNAPLCDNGAQKMNGTVPYPSVQGMVQQFTAAGVSKSKIGIGLAFYGYVWSGASAPGQSIAGVKVEDSVDYHTIMDTYYRPERYHWDDQAKAPYLSVIAPTLKESKFISYDNERLCALKLAYLKQQGLGGAIIWELGSGYRANQPEGQKDMLLQAVKKAWLSPLK